MPTIANNPASSAAAILPAGALPPNAPELGSVLDSDYLIGLGTLDERMLILVDIDKLMSSEEMGLIAQAVH